MDLLCDDAAPSEVTVAGNTHLQVGVIMDMLRESGAGSELIENAGTRAARYNTGRNDAVPDVDQAMRRPTQNSKRTFAGSK
eukprot:7083987-Prymnesium_polylepis.1